MWPFTKSKAQVAVELLLREVQTLTDRVDRLHGKINTLQAASEGRPTPVPMPVPIAKRSAPIKAPPKRKPAAKA